jgi:glucose-6-phosphate dehydrogenase assembly protein OpcA
MSMTTSVTTTMIICAAVSDELVDRTAGIDQTAHRAARPIAGEDRGQSGSSDRDLDVDVMSAV